MQKGFTPLFLLPVILIGLLAVYLIYAYIGSILNTPIARPAPSPTVTPESSNSAVMANWKTYSSLKYNYELKYPNNWTIKVENFDQPDQTGHLERLTLNQQDYKTSNHFSSIVIEGTQGAYSSTWPNNYTKNATIAGLNAYRYSLSGGQNPAQELAAFQEGNSYFTLQLVGGDKDYINIFDQILSTFKFTP